MVKTQDEIVGKMSRHDDKDEQSRKYPFNVHFWFRRIDDFCGDFWPFQTTMVKMTCMVVLAEAAFDPWRSIVRVRGNLL